MLFYSIGNFSEFSYRIKTLRGMRTAAYKVDVAMRPPQARVSQAKLFSYSIGNFSEFSYRIKTLRGMRTTRIRKMAASAAALWRECASRRTLFLFYLGNFSEFFSNKCMKFFSMGVRIFGGNEEALSLQFMVRERTVTL